AGPADGPRGRPVRGQAPGRTRADEVTVFKAVGSALEDLTLAALVYEACSGQAK
ncbi:MAG: hypothetical protein KBO60_21170, partial [Achromobacter sp.]|nr:hypothetical protein [Achromobacter sp.]